MSANETSAAQNALREAALCFSLEKLLTRLSATAVQHDQRGSHAI